MSSQSQSSAPLRRRITIVTSDKHFLYLPLYYAEHCKFFGFVPERYQMVIENSRDKTDESAYQTLMRRGHNEAQFGVFDPVWTLQRTGVDPDSQPAIVGALVTNAAFWAVDRRTHEVKYLLDLGKFDRIISYRQGTTSYAIAARLHRDAKPTVSIKSFIEDVDRGNELLALTNSKKGTVALSPDPLAIDALLAVDPSFGIDMSLGTTPEYSNVLVSALVTRQDVIASDPELIEGLVRALQRAVLRVRISDQDVIDFAHDYFQNGNHAHAALRRAADAQVFPMSLEVSEAHWMNAVRAAWDGRGGTFGAIVQNEARQAFDKWIRPHTRFAVAAVRLELLPQPPPAIERRLPRDAAWLITVVVLCAFAIGKALSWPAAGTTLLVTAYGAGVAYWCRRWLNRHVQILHWVLMVGTCLVLAGYMDWQWEAGISLGVLTMLVGADLGIVGSAVASKR